MNEEEITKEKAEDQYEKAGTLIPEDPEEITINEHTHLLNDSVMLIVREVLDETPLPFKLQDFQLLTLYCLGSLKNVILISPTGTGKMICAYLGVKVLQKVFGISKGVGLITQPLRYIKIGW